MIEAKDLQAPAQAAHDFRAILDAFAKPGQPMTVPKLAEKPAALHDASVVLALALCDYQSPVWLSPRINQTEVRSFLRFHTGSPIVSSPAEAHFAFIESGEFAKYFALFNKGNDEYPDRSATVIVQASAFEARQRVRLEGPGIKLHSILAVAGFGPMEWNLLSEDRILFPLGIDVAFISDTKLVGLPRSTRITTLEDR
jgi:alpha-D-ribose 1-methylphosphonate 5-triphosphate synthase subunit PhnH